MVVGVERSEKEDVKKMAVCHSPMTPASAGRMSPKEMRHFILLLRALALLLQAPDLTRGAWGMNPALSPLCTLLVEPEPAPLEEQLAGCRGW